MSVRARLLSLWLLAKIEENSGYAREIGIDGSLLLMDGAETENDEVL